jgi:ESF2/ABP1 family protein
VEYADKKVAKGVAKALHMQKIGGKKRSFYAEDVWTLKYLKHFTWSHLTEKKAYERRVRDYQLQLEMVQSKKQNEEYRQLVDHTAANAAVAARKAKKAATTAGADDASSSSSSSGLSGGKKKFKVGHGGMKGLGVEAHDLAHVQQRFRQHQPLSVNDGGAGLSARALSSAFGRSAKS